MKTFDIWMEGFIVQGNEAEASFVATVRANSFREACIKHYKDNPSDYFDAEDLSYWGCRLFDNETKARISFG
jgi:hypothetical protein